MSTITTITLYEWRSETAMYWQRNAKQWMQVIDTDTDEPLWEIRRASFKVTDNISFCRIPWTEFVRGRVGDMQTMLINALGDKQVVVITVYGADVFIARLPQDEIVDDGSETVLWGMEQ